jgi:hypothetical protein
VFLDLLRPLENAGHFIRIEPHPPGTAGGVTLGKKTALQLSPAQNAPVDPDALYHQAPLWFDFVFWLSSFHCHERAVSVLWESSRELD